MMFYAVFFTVFNVVARVAWGGLILNSEIVINNTRALVLQPFIVMAQEQVALTKPQLITIAPVARFDTVATRPTALASNSAVSGVKVLSEDELSLQLVSAILIDANTGERLLEQNADEQQAIASISKLMAALVFLDHNPGWDEEYTVRKSDIRNGNKANIHPGERLSVRDVFYDALVASDNIAVIGLVNLTGLTEDQFVDQMNIRALSMGLKDTVFNDPTGLANGNVSTAAEVAVFARQAFLQADIHEAVLTNSHTLTILPDTKRRITNTDDMLDGDLEQTIILGGKTGYIEKAGYCFVGNFIRNQQEVISVVLGAKSRQDRFTETAKILDWYYNDKRDE
jgi:D-alanyl-D-alanine carboxypeptidase (penicillin-binding protein 5/6)